MTSPNINPSKTVHSAPQTVKQVNRMTPKQVGAVGTIIVDLILAQTALALAGVTILGVKPFDFMRGWATTLTNKAQDAYKNAFIVVDVRANSPVGTTTTGTAAAVYNATQAVNVSANNGETNSGIANNNIQSTWNGIYAAAGGTASGDQNLSKAQTQLGAVTTATTTNTGNIQSTWNGIYTGSGGTGSGDQTLSTAQTKLSTVATNASSATVNVQTAIDGINQAVTGTGATGATAGTVGTNINTVKTTATAAAEGVTNTNKAIYNGYFGSGATGAAAEAQTAIEAIKTKLQSGWNLQTLTYNGSSTQKLTISGSPTGGTFTLTYGANTTATIAYNASAATVQSGLVALASIGAGKATVTGDATAGYVVILDSSITSPLAIGATSSLTGGTSPTVTVRPMWTVPWTPSGSDKPGEFWALVFGSGSGGYAGVSLANTTSGGTTAQNGGSAGGYGAIQIDPSAVDPTISFYVAPGGAGGTTFAGAGISGASTVFGSYITSIPGTGFVSNIWGYYDATLSTPGKGGTGGYAQSGSPFSVAGNTGGSSLLGAGGAGGTANTAAKAGAGGTVSVTGTTRAGGGGGGGGGGTYNSSSSGAKDAGSGGSGGFPGGGGGAGGNVYTFASSSSATFGTGGAGANGVIILLWK